MHRREFRELICSMLLGDGSVYVSGTPGHTGATFWMEHSRAQEDYILWKKHQIEECLRKRGLDRQCRVHHRDRKDRRTGRTYSSVLVGLHWKRYLSILRRKVYTIESQKRVEFLLKQISTPKSLAIWFMDDGSESRTKAKHIDGAVYYKNPYFRLATQSFTLGENELIRQWFKSNHGVEPNITLQRSGPILQFSVKDTRYLFPLIRPYVIQMESMRRKFRTCLERY